MLKTNEPILIHIGTSGQGHQTVNFGGQEVKVKVKQGRRFGGLTETSFSTMVSSLFTILCGIHNSFMHVLCFFVLFILFIIIIIIIITECHKQHLVQGLQGCKVICICDASIKLLIS